MKKISMLLAFGLITLPSAFAAPCGSGVAFSSWLTSGFSCSIGDKTFSNFSYVASGTNQVPATGVTVSTVGPTSSGASILGTNIGLQFNAPWNAASGQSSDAEIAFEVTVSTGPQLISDLGLAQIDGINAPGTASVAERSCTPGPFCTPTTAGLLTFDQSGSSTLSTTMLLSTTTGSIYVIKDIAATGNASPGFADLSVVTDTFSQTPIPEPVSMGLLGGGLALLGLARLRRSGRKV